MDLMDLHRQWLEAQARKPKEPYDFLKEELNRFVGEKLCYDASLKFVVSVPETERLIAEDAPTLEPELEKRLLKDFIEPWLDLSWDEMQAVASHWNRGMGYMRHLAMEIHPLNGIGALQWTVAQALLLLPNVAFLPRQKRKVIPTLPLEILCPDREHALPYHQCGWCGRLDRDPRKVKFGKLKFCHLPGCPSNESDYNQHKHGCCYREWRQITKNFTIQKNQHKNDPGKQTQLFRRFCDRRFAENLNMKIPLRTRKVNLQVSKPFE